jgi:hypothetical protein
MRHSTLIAGLCAAAFIARAAAGVQPSPLAGSWDGLIVIRPAEYELDVNLEVESTENGLRGRISYPTQDVHEQPLESVTLADDKVSFVAKDSDGIVSDFHGWLTEGGEVITGELDERGAHYIFRLHRREGPPSARPVPASLDKLSSDGRELRALFNQDQGKVRLLMILSPTCPMCRNGARVVQRYLLDALQSQDVRVYLVWESVGSPDTEAKAREASVFLADPRVHQLWSPDRFAGKAFQQAIGLQGSPAWDVFLLFAPGKKWESAPPAIDSFMHNLSSHEELPRDRHLNGTQLAREVMALLAKVPAAGR